MAQTLGQVNLGLEVRSHGAHVDFDPVGQQHMLAFDFTLQVAVPQMLQSLLSFKHPEASTQCQGLPPAVLPREPQASPARPWPPVRRREPPPPPPDSNMPLTVMPGTPSPPQAPPQAPPRVPPLAQPLAAPPLAPPLAPGVTPVFASNPLFMQAPSPHSSYIQSPEVNTIARSTLPQVGCNEFVPPCLPPEQPPAPCLPPERPPAPVLVPVPAICKPEILATHRDEEEVHGVAFGDTELDRIIFYTENSIGSFSMEQNRLVSKHKLTSRHLHCRIQDMAVNPSSGAVACMLESPIGGGAQTDGQNLCNIETIITFWPGGALHEAPLRLSIRTDDNPTDLIPPAIVSSTSAGPQTVVCRVCTQKVFYWRFESISCPMEVTIAPKGGLIAISSTGSWLAVVEEDDYGKHRTKIWSCDNSSTPPVPSLVSSLDRNPRAMTIAHQGDTVLLALSDGCLVESPVPPVEVFAIQPDGRVARTHKLAPESPCMLLTFCFDNPNFIVFATEDGVVNLHNLATGTKGMHRDDAKIRTVCLSANHEFILSAYDNVFQVYKAVQPAK